ncbi:MAG: hypothetical protein VKJ04_02220 [Vampirovibrionales bacterium]|nr:hypothetical protein [Vampirovibrionales bacterium]
MFKKKQTPSQFQAANPPSSNSPSFGQSKFSGNLNLAKVNFDFGLAQESPSSEMGQAAWQTAEAVQAISPELDYVPEHLETSPPDAVFNSTEAAFTPLEEPFPDPVPYLPPPSELTYDALPLETDASFEELDSAFEEEAAPTPSIAQNVLADLPEARDLYASNLTPPPLVGPGWDDVITDPSIVSPIGLDSLGTDLPAESTTQWLEDASKPFDSMKADSLREDPFAPEPPLQSSSLGPDDFSSVWDSPNDSEASASFEDFVSAEETLSQTPEKQPEKQFDDWTRFIDESPASSGPTPDVMFSETGFSETSSPQTSPYVSHLPLGIYPPESEPWQAPATEVLQYPSVTSDMSAQSVYGMELPAWSPDPEANVEPDVGFDDIAQPEISFADEHPFDQPDFYSEPQSLNIAHSGADLPQIPHIPTDSAFDENDSAQLDTIWDAGQSNLESSAPPRSIAHINFLQEGINLEPGQEPLPKADISQPLIQEHASAPQDAFLNTWENAGRTPDEVFLPPPQETPNTPAIDYWQQVAQSQEQYQNTDTTPLGGQQVSASREGSAQFLDTVHDAIYPDIAFNAAGDSFDDAAAMLFPETVQRHQPQQPLTSPELEGFDASYLQGGSWHDPAMAVEAEVSFDDDNFLQNPPLSQTFEPGSEPHASFNEQPAFDADEPDEKDENDWQSGFEDTLEPEADADSIQEPPLSQSQLSRFLEDDSTQVTVNLEDFAPPPLNFEPLSPNDTFGYAPDPISPQEQPQASAMADSQQQSQHQNDEALNILQSLDMTRFHRLLFISHQQHYALMGQVGPEEDANIAVLKIFNENPLQHDNEFIAIKEGQTPKKEMFVVKLGTWQGVVAVDADQIQLQAEIAV